MLKDVYTYTIEQHGLARARKYLDGLHACFEHLAEHPMLGRPADRIAHGVRRHECQSHVVFYVADGSGVNIARVLHARMDAPRRYVRESAADWQRDLIRERLAVLEDVLPEARSVPWEAIRERIFTARRGMPYD